MAWRTILRAEAPQETLNELRSLFPSDDFEPFQFSELHRSVLSITGVTLDQILSSREQDLDVLDSNGMTPLAWAVERADHASVKLLLAAGADANACGFQGRSPLRLAVSRHDLECIKLLIQAGSDISQVNYFGRNLFHQSNDSSRFNLDMLELLLNAGVAIDFPDKDGSTPLCGASSSNHPRLAQFLLERGADPSIPDNDGDSVLNNVMFHASHDCLSVLLQHGAPYDTINKAGDTILHYAANHADVHSIEILLDFKLKGIDTHTRNHRGKTASQLAWDRIIRPEGFIEAFQALLFEIGVRHDNARRVEWHSRIVGETSGRSGEGG
ncbi:MAG: hypothetical protein MMC33_007546 [Icmadophila ericetorum]|nr:hypothetical protein [Icmadophila ericetorum]